MRPKGVPTNWIGGFPTDVPKPPCYGKKKWLGVNKACQYLFLVEFFYECSGELAMVEDEVLGSDPYEPFYEDG